VIKARQTILRVSEEQMVLLKATQLGVARCWNNIVALTKAHYDAIGNTGLRTSPSFAAG